MAEAPALALRRLGTVPYEEALALQQELVDARVAGDVPDTLLLLEHPPVFTVGRRRDADANLLATGETPVVRVFRGGDVTWHGPGQLVGYPILALGPDERDVHAVLRAIELALVDVLGTLGLEAGARPGFTGVWCGAAKVASIGVAVRRWVTFHGFALNVDCDLSWFQRIHPCGLPSGVMASVQSLGGPVPPREALELAVAEAVARRFGRQLRMG